MDQSRIPAFYKLSITDRLQMMRERGLLSHGDYRGFASGGHTLSVDSADKMIENVIGVMGLPVGLGLNFLINDKDYVIPLVVEEPSIVAALSSAAKIARRSGGFTVESEEQLLIGQIQVVDMVDSTKAQKTLLQRKEELLSLADSLHPKMAARGGGVKDLEVHVHANPGGGDMLVVHLLVDTCDAMGANMVNTVCEGVAGLVQTMTAGKVFLRILSNLTDRALVRARVRIGADHLAGRGFAGEEVRDGIVLANDFASVDPYRATTHNKGIMNGVDAVALATGNDWRALEAAAHAYAARGTRYTSLTRWQTGEDGALLGEIDIPIKVGTVGGPLQSNPTVAANLRILGVDGARELAHVMAAVGLAQNFAALRALVTSGIQSGHMTLHARSVAMAAGTPAALFDRVVERLIEEGDIKIWKAEQIVRELRQQAPQSIGTASRLDESTTTPVEQASAGNGKVILFGEHAVVYGTHAIAAPVPLAVQARVTRTEQGKELLIPRWGVEERLHKRGERLSSFQQSLGLILDTLELNQRRMRIEVFPNVPRAMGLGGSAAVAVAIIRGLDQHFQLGLDDADVNALAYECEKVAHGTPSGIDNTLATYGRFMLFQPGDPPVTQDLHAQRPIPLVIGMSGVESLTAKTVGRVRHAWQKNPALYERIFAEIDALVLDAMAAIKAHDLEQLGELMNVNHGLLSALQVSSWEIDELNQIARQNGALGSKLTGGGGSMIALCPEDDSTPRQIVEAMRAAGYQAMEIQIG